MHVPNRIQHIESLRRTPERLGDLVSGLDSACLTYKPSTETFSIRENVHHLRDIEVEGFARRLGRLLNEHQPPLSGIDGERLARERRYNEHSHEGALEEFRRARRESISCLERLSQEGWERAGELETVGRVTIEKLVELCCDHDRDHLQQVETIVNTFGRGTLPRRENRS